MRAHLLSPLQKEEGILFQRKREMMEGEADEEEEYQPHDDLFLKEERPKGHP